MKTTAPIKIIKRDERSRHNADAEGSAANKTTQQTARDMVTTVSGWVSEFQQKRRSETRQAIKTLFSDATAQPS